MNPDRAKLELWLTYAVTREEINLVLWELAKLDCQPPRHSAELMAREIDPPASPGLLANLAARFAALFH